MSLGRSVESVRYRVKRMGGLLMGNLNLKRWEQIFTPILHWIDGKQGEKPKPESYPYGSRGPEGIDAFTSKYGFKRSNDG
jgi:hypothetical protein